MHARSIEQTENDSFDITTLLPSRTAPRSQHQSLCEFTNSKKTQKREREKRDAPCGGEYERASGKRERRREVFPRKLSQSCTTLQWLQTPVGRTQVLLRKEIALLLRRRCFNCFVVRRSHVGFAEVVSSAGRSKENLTSLEMEKFSSSSCCINCTSTKYPLTKHYLYRFLFVLLLCD